MRGSLHSIVHNPNDIEVLSAYHPSVNVHHTNDSSILTDMVCFIVYGDSPSEIAALKTDDSVAYLEPVPVSAALHENLINSVTNGGSSAFGERFRDADALSIHVFPTRLATQARAQDFQKGLQRFAKNHTIELQNGCEISIDDDYLSAHFHDYFSSSFNFSVNDTAGCAFDDIQFEASRSSSMGEIFVNLRGIHDAGRYGNTCGWALLVYLSARPEVIKIAPMGKIEIHDNAQASGTVITGTPYLNPLYDMGISGDGQVVGISDTGVDQESCFFSDSLTGRVEGSTWSSDYTVDQSRRKVIMYISPEFGDEDDCNGHGTHTAGSIAGNSGGRDGTAFDGVAKEAKLAVMDFESSCGAGLDSVPSDIISTFLVPMHDEAGARIHSASWGSLQTNLYDDFARQMDQFVFEHPEHLVVVAAGNRGTDGSSSVTSPATAKNVLTVGSTCPDADYIPGFSSMGPLYDGRIKPDVMAPGVGVVSAGSGFGEVESCETNMLSGTSMSTPITAGAATLLREYLKKGLLNNFRINPSAALLKAMIINSAVHISARYYDEGCIGSFARLDGEEIGKPSGVQGFGRAELSNVLPGLVSEFETRIFDNEEIRHGEIDEHIVRVDSDVQRPLRITLVWTDPPPNVLTGDKTLVHDLDLKVVSLSGAFDDIYPNGQDWEDRQNNVERIIIPMDVLQRGGDIRVQITGHEILHDDFQLYSLVISGEFSYGEETLAPTGSPLEPSRFPTMSPSLRTLSPTRPKANGSLSPTTTASPVVAPTAIPFTSLSPTVSGPTMRPTRNGSRLTAAPSTLPNVNLTQAPSITTTSPTTGPTASGSRETMSPSTMPTVDPTHAPASFGFVSSKAPTSGSEANPTMNPTMERSRLAPPSTLPTVDPTKAPLSTGSPTLLANWTLEPTTTTSPSSSLSPTVVPTTSPSIRQPSATPTNTPPLNVTGAPSEPKQILRSPAPSASPSSPPTTTYSPTFAPTTSAPISIDRTEPSPASAQFLGGIIWSIFVDGGNSGEGIYAELTPGGNHVSISGLYTCAALTLLVQLVALGTVIHCCRGSKSSSENVRTGRSHIESRSGVGASIVVDV
mmetsp:Transcript_22204/g.43185  ORF Transcript_22204/g.43185 Transcript_22204/m.43185 type:complete len:1080 (+) Transcript_22204:2-3241(+)